VTRLQCLGWLCWTIAASATAVSNDCHIWPLSFPQVLPGTRSTVLPNCAQRPEMALGSPAPSDDERFPAGYVSSTYPGRSPHRTRCDCSSHFLKSWRVLRWARSSVLWCATKFPHRDHKSQSLDPIPIHLNSTHVTSILILSSYLRFRLRNGLFPSSFLSKILYNFLPLCVLYGSPITSSCYFLPLVSRYPHIISILIVLSVSPLHRRRRQIMV